MVLKTPNGYRRRSSKVSPDGTLSDAMRFGGRFSSLSQFVPRPQVGIAGRKILLISNHYPVYFDSSRTVHHYDVTIERVPQAYQIAAAGDDRKRFRKLSLQTNRAVIDQLVKTNQNPGQLFRNIIPVFDGNKNLFTVRPIVAFLHEPKPKRMTVTIIEDNYRESQFVVWVKYTGNTINFNTLKMYYEQKSNTIPYPAIQVLDIVLRHGSSASKIPVGASLFMKEEDGDKRMDLGGGKLLSFGFYQSVRPCSDGTQLVVDRSCSVFYARCSIQEFIYKLFPFRDAQNMLQSPKWNDAERRRLERELKGLQMEVNHQGFTRKYRIQGISREPANQIYFDYPLQKNGVIQSERISVADYFRMEYKTLKYPWLPCGIVKSGPRPMYFPIEVCTLVADQSVRRKLSAQQTSDMIRICASTKPRERFAVIGQAAKEIAEGSNNGDFLKEFSVKIGTQPVAVSGRVLQAPDLLEKNGKVASPQNGKWRINQFYKAAELHRWIVVNVSDLEETPILAFIENLKKTGQKIGMIIEEPLCRVKAIYKRGLLKERIFDKAFGKFGMLDLILFLGIEGDDCYYEIKRCAEIDVGIATQCVKKSNIAKCSHSLITNLLLKINAKLGGENSVVSALPPVLKARRVIVIGADVAHPAPLDRFSAASVSAVVGTVDHNCMRHYASVRVQSRVREEIIKDLDSMVNEVLYEYAKKNSGFPDEIIFYRDGISEGQFSHVFDYEIRKIKQAAAMLSAGYEPKITFVIVQKRHHTRFIPDDERQGIGAGKNIPPGTVVDTAVVHPTDFDFFLCSHEGIQGTSRPTHYYVIHDDNNYGADDLQSLTYFLCHTYSRCTRSISIPAPVYYAHLAAYRGRGHIIGSSDSDSGSSGSNGSSPGRQMRQQFNFESLSEKIMVKGNVKSSMYFC